MHDFGKVSMEPYFMFLIYYRIVGVGLRNA